MKLKRSKEKDQIYDDTTSRGIKGPNSKFNELNE
jgi:hypothetical protein